MSDDVLNIRLPATHKRALRIIATRLKYKNLTSYVLSVLEKHTPMIQEAILLASIRSDMDENSPEVDESVQSPPTYTDEAA